MTRIERVRGGAADFHARTFPGDGHCHLWWFDVQRPALVLGSTQHDELVDDAACRRCDVEVVRRRSGGGAVLLWPDEVVWLDIVIPSTHLRWHDDVGRAVWWVGEVWAEALNELGVGSDRGVQPAVHRGGLVATTWSRQVCFAGLGPGEVTLDGKKLVGISQRRTRGAARFQCALYRHWRPEVLGQLLKEPRPTVEELDVVAVCEADVDELVDVVTRRMVSRLAAT